MKKEFLAVVFALEKFCSHLINSKVTVFTDHVALKHLLQKSNTKPRLIRWVFLLQEFDLEILDKAGLENLVANHLSYLGPKATPVEEIPIHDSSLGDKLLAISH